MNVVDMGQFGPKRPSVLHGLTEALQKNQEMNMQKQELQLRTQQMQNEQQYRSQEMARQLAQLQRETDKDQFEKEQKMAEHGKKVAEDLSMKLYTMKDGPDGVMAKTLMTAPSMQEVVKGLKKTNPEFIDTQGNFNPIPPKEIYKDKFYSQMIDAKDRLMADSYPKTTEGAKAKAMDYQVAGRFNSASIDEASNIMQDETMNPSAQSGSQQHHQNIFEKLQGVFAPKKPATPQANPNTQALAEGNQPMAPQANVPQQGGNTADPTKDILNAGSSV